MRAKLPVLLAICLSLDCAANASLFVQGRLLAESSGSFQGLGGQDSEPSSRWRVADNAAPALNGKVIDNGTATLQGIEATHATPSLRGRIFQDGQTRLLRPRSASQNANVSVEIEALNGSASARSSGGSPLAGLIDTSDFHLPMSHIPDPRTFMPRLPNVPRLWAPAAPDFSLPLDQGRLGLWRNQDFQLPNNMFGAGARKLRHPLVVMPDLNESADFINARVRAEALKKQADLRLQATMNASRGWPELFGSMVPPGTGLPARLPQPVDETIVWKPWYEQVGAAFKDAWMHQKKDSGEARVRITVHRSGKIEADIIAPCAASEEFQQTLIDTITSFDSSSVLEFPKNSRRLSLSFKANFKSGMDRDSGLQFHVYDYEHITKPAK